MWVFLKVDKQQIGAFPYQLMWSVDSEASPNPSNPTLTLTTNPTSHRSAPIVN